MNTSETNIHEVEKKLMPLYFEIALLERRVEEANPDVKARCFDPVKSLSSQYKFVETQVQALGETEKETQEENLKVVQSNLQELQSNIASIGRWVWIETAGQI